MFKKATVKRKVIVATILIIFLAAIIIGISVIMRYRNYQVKVDNIVFSDIDINSLEDGMYTGEYDADVIYAKVEVTILNGAIINIRILEHRNERGSNAETIIDEIIEKQRLDVDAISSATNSSKVIRKAIENALTISS